MMKVTQPDMLKAAERILRAQPGSLQCRGAALRVSNDTSLYRFGLVENGVLTDPDRLHILLDGAGGFQATIDPNSEHPKMRDGYLLKTDDQAVMTMDLLVNIGVAKKMSDTPQGLPECLTTLETSEKEHISITLANDEVSSDEEIVELWTKECGIPNDAALAAIKFRSNFFMDPLFELFDGLYQTPDATMLVVAG